MRRVFLKEIVLLFCNLCAHALRLQKHPAVLMYHSFDETKWKHGVSPKEIQKHTQFLLQKHKIVDLEDIISFAKGEKELSKKSVAITVDDGYKDTYTVLFPLAKKHQFPFTIFLTTDLTPQKKLGDLPRPRWSQLQEMVDSGLVTIGVHGHTHISFPEVFKKGEKGIEIVDSKSLIFQKLGVRSTVIAYPAGRYDDEVYTYVQQNYSAALSTHQGHIQVGDDVWKLKRVPVDRSTSLRLLKARLQPGYGLYLWLLRRLRKW